MDSTTDELKGRGKEAAGDLTDDDDLKRERKIEHQCAKDRGDDAKEKEWAEHKVEALSDNLTND